MENDLIAKFMEELDREGFKERTKRKHRDIRNFLSKKVPTEWWFIKNGYFLLGFSIISSLEALLVGSVWMFYQHAYYSYFDLVILFLYVGLVTLIIHFLIGLETRERHA